MSLDQRPVLVLQNLTSDGPGYLGTWLRQRQVPFEVFDTEAGQDYPPAIDGYRALALLGGEMSANDPLPSLRQAERLILQAMDAAAPVIGHCLGGQLMARALGARVVDSPRPEIGWQSISVGNSAEARQWFGEPEERTIFHWHAESFELPTGACLLAESPACPRQAFAYGPHLALQFHLELDLGKLQAWSASCDAAFLRLQREHPATVQSGAAMRRQASEALTEQHRWADRIYARWLEGSG